MHGFLYTSELSSEVWSVFVQVLNGYFEFKYKFYCLYYKFNSFVCSQFVIRQTKTNLFYLYILQFRELKNWALNGQQRKIQILKNNHLGKSVNKVLEAQIY